jgi:class 3 adenylate cyclase
MSDPKAELRARLRHDLRTPLHQILGYAELLEEETLDRGHVGYVADLRNIQAAARHALKGVDAAVPPNVEEPIGETEPAAAAVEAQLAEAPGSDPPSVAASSAPSLPASTAGTAGARLLLVDDNEANRQMLSRRLGQRGYLVDTAEEGEAALARLSTASYDALLLDVMMPGLGGLEVLERVRQRWPASDLPVIMVTACDKPEDVVEALRRGANDYVTKPLDLPVVLARIETQLTLRRQNQEIHRLADDLESSSRFVRALFGRYLSDEVVSGLLASPEGPRLGGEYRRVTLLMSDLRGFTQLTEDLPPEDVLRLLNSYLGAMADVIMSHHGMVDEFVGDAILAIFGAPLAGADDARRAVLCAVEMQAAIAELNRQNDAERLPALEMGVAVHTGEVIVGNIGSERRTKYGVVGSAVNHAGRIESFTIGGQVLISEATLREAGDDVRVASRLAVDAKGTREPIVVYELSGIGDSCVPIVPDDMVTLPQVLDAVCHVVSGKKVQAEGFAARVLELSLRGGTLLAYRRVRMLSNLKIEIWPPNHQPLEVYAKVVHTSRDGTLGVRFVVLPTDASNRLKELLRDARAAGAVAR